MAAGVGPSQLQVGGGEDKCERRPGGDGLFERVALGEVGPDGDTGAAPHFLVGDATQRFGGDKVTGHTHRAGGTAEDGSFDAGQVDVGEGCDLDLAGGDDGGDGPDVGFDVGLVVGGHAFPAAADVAEDGFADGCYLVLISDDDVAGLMVKHHRTSTHPERAASRRPRSTSPIVLRRQLDAQDL